MPTFCRHNRLVVNCPICSREQGVDGRAVVSSAAPRSSQPREPRQATRSGSRSRSGSSGGVRVRRMARGADDGYSSPLLPGLRSSSDAERLAEEFAFATARLTALETEPPGLYAEVADASAGIEEQTWLAFQIAYIGPLDGDAPFETIEARRTTWASGELPDLDGAATGPRSAYVPARGAKVLEAYRGWVERAGSQQAAFTGEPSWTPERRFARIFERLGALAGLHRDSRFDLLVTLGRTGVYPLAADAVHFGGENEATVAAKRALGIGDTLLLERRARDLAEAAGVPLEALDLGLHNWGTGRRATLGLGGAEPDESVLESARSALGL